MKKSAGVCYSALNVPIFPTNSYIFGPFLYFRITGQFLPIFPIFLFVISAIPACLALAHGSADVERGFSLNKRTVTADRVSLDGGTNNALCMIKDGLKCRVQGSALNMAVTPSLLRSARAVYLFTTYGLVEQSL